MRPCNLQGSRIFEDLPWLASIWAGSYAPLARTVDQSGGTRRKTGLRTLYTHTLSRLFQVFRMLVGQCKAAPLPPFPPLACRVLHSLSCVVQVGTRHHSVKKEQASERLLWHLKIGLHTRAGRS